MEIRRVSRKEAAAALGVTRQRLEKLIAQGRVSENSDGIDLEVARREYAATLDPARKLAWDLRSKKALDPPTAVLAQSVRVSEPPPQAPAVVTMSSAEPVQGVFDFAKARARKEAANADIAELKFKQQLSLLIPRDEVAAKEFAIARKLRDRILGLPARLANYVPPEAMKTIIDECDMVCRELQEEAAKVAENSAA